MGGLAKVVVRPKEAAGVFFQYSDDMVQFLDMKFRNTSNVVYHFKSIDTVLLDEARSLDLMIMLLLFMAHPLSMLCCFHLERIVLRHPKEFVFVKNVKTDLVHVNSFQSTA